MPVSRAWEQSFPSALMGSHIQWLMLAVHCPEINYFITELETLAVVWAINHFHHCLYRRAVTVYTDHSAVKAILATPNPTGKHARWWNKVYGSGISKVEIIYRAGKEYVFADALFATLSVLHCLI